MRYVYDKLDNLTEVWYNDGGSDYKAYVYTYTDSGQLARFDNLLTNESTIYTYDASGKLIGYSECDTDDNTVEHGVQFRYNEHSQVNRQIHTIDYLSGSTVGNHYYYYYYTYNDTGTLKETEVKLGDGYTGDLYHGTINYTHDAYNRLTQSVTNIADYYNSSRRFLNTVKYEYTLGAYNRTSTQISKYSSQVNSNTEKTYEYTYDANGNITKIKVSDGNEYRYKYDDIGQLIREDNTVSGRTYIYTYDNAGNILEKVAYSITAANSTPTSMLATYTYEYGNTTWGDQLTAYNKKPITYDAIGNPLTYFNGLNYTFTWKNGRQLATVSGAANATFEYNDEGIRTSKTVGGVKHTYYLYGSQIVAEEWGNKLLVYLYDTSGSPIGMQYRTTSYAEGVFDTYWFEKNLQGDIVAVYNDAGTLLATYAYDAWGGNASLHYYNSGASTGAAYNPFRYRGYYFDTETGFYYVSSRYYDPEIGRWINADGQISGVSGDILGYNTFAYCMNNPVNMSDPSGNWPRWITAAVTVVAAVVTVAAAATGNVAVASVAAKVGIVAGATYLVQTAHYDVRASKNKGMDEMTYEEAVAIPGADPNVSDTFHDFSGDNNKVCLKDGREGIYDSSGKYVDDSRDIGTYNFFVPKGFGSGVGHIVVDVFPYFIFGNNDNDPGPIVNFAEKWVNNLITLFE